MYLTSSEMLSLHQINMAAYFFNLGKRLIEFLASTRPKYKTDFFLVKPILLHELFNFALC